MWQRRAFLKAAGAGFLASLLVFYLIAWPVNGIAPSWTLLALPPVFLASAIFNLGLASLTARLAIPFRDINNLIPHITRLWLYLSPIIWPVAFLDSLPTWAERIFKATGLSSLTTSREIVRSCWPSWPRIRWRFLSTSFNSLRRRLMKKDWSELWILLR